MEGDYFTVLRLINKCLVSLSAKIHVIFTLDFVHVSVSSEVQYVNTVATSGSLFDLRGSRVVTSVAFR